MTHLDTPQSICRVGIARCDVTRPVGIYHRMGGAAIRDRAIGVHRPLTANLHKTLGDRQCIRALEAFLEQTVAPRP
jgi:hypothetical protein